MSVNDDTTPPTTDSSAPLDVSTPAPTGAANVPNLMMIGAMPINTQMNVETDRLFVVSVFKIKVFSIQILKLFLL